MQAFMSVLASVREPAARNRVSSIIVSNALRTNVELLRLALIGLSKPSKALNSAVRPSRSHPHRTWTYYDVPTNASMNIRLWGRLWSTLSTSDRQGGG